MTVDDNSDNMKQAQHVATEWKGGEEPNPNILQDYRLYCVCVCVRESACVLCVCVCVCVCACACACVCLEQECLCIL